MKIDKKDLKLIPINQLYEILKPMLTKLQKEYSIFQISNDLFQEICEESINSLYEKAINNEEKLEISILEKQIRKKLNQYIQTKELNSQERLTIFQIFIKENIHFSNNAETNLQELKKLSTFFTKMKVIPTPDLCLEILNQNELLNSLIKVIIDNNIDVIRHYDIEKISNNHIITSFLETYCMKNEITTEEIEEDINKMLKENIPTYSDDSVKMYLQEIRSPLLTVEEEQELAYKIKNGDQQAKEIFIKRNLRLVVSIAKKYIGRGLPFLDLIQEGNIGLITAVDRYDVSKGFKFSTYATWWIKQAISRNLSKQGRNIRVPLHVAEKLAKYKQVRYCLTEKLNREPTIEEIAKELRISIEEATNLYKLQVDTISTNSPINDDNDCELEETIPSESKSVEEEVIDKTLPKEIEKLLEKSQLYPREINIITLKYGLNNTPPKTLGEIGNIYGITAERVRQIINEAIKKMRRSKYLKNLADYMDQPINLEENIKKRKKETKKRIKRDLTNLYYYFQEYSEEEITAMLEMLTNKELEVLHKRYGPDFLNPTFNNDLPEEEKKQLRASIFPRMKRILLKNKLAKEKSQPSSKTTSESANTTEESSSITKEDYITLLSLLRSKEMTPLTQNKSTLECIIFLLKFGYINGKCFSNHSIAYFLDMEQSKVIEIVKKNLMTYKKVIAIETKSPIYNPKKLTKEKNSQ